MQAGSQSGKQVGRQTETHSLGFFSGGLPYKQRGSVQQTNQRSNGNATSQQPTGRRFEYPARPTAGPAARSTILVLLDPGHKLLNPPSKKK